MNCYACQKRLEPVYDDVAMSFGKLPANTVYTSTDATAETRQCDNALEITFEGGYGMFIDPMPEFGGEPNPNVIICHECAHDLCEKIPWIKELLNPHGSHSHKESYHVAHPDHWGWDYDRRKADQDG